MPNKGRYIVCPYYKDHTNKTIVCENCPRRFRWKSQRQKFMLIYCENNWQSCEHAKKLEQMYKRIEEGSDMAKEKHIDKVQEQAKEIKKLQKMLDKAEGKIEELKHDKAMLKEKKEMIEEHYKVLLRKYEQEKRNATKIAVQVSTTVSTYEARFCYLLDKIGEEFDEKAFNEWSKDKEFALITSERDKDGVPTKFKAVVREVKKNGNKIS